MAAAGVHWRNFRRVLAALIVSVFMLSPAIDAVLCQDDFSAAASHHSHDGAVQADHDHYGERHGETDGTCIHGHSHHSAPCLADSSVLTATLFAQAQPYGPAPGSLPLSDRRFGLMRPPRA